MGCFSACFGCSSNRHRKTKNPNGTKDFDQKIEPTTKAQIADPLKINAEPEDENEEQLNGSARKKVAFDSNVKIHEEECANQFAEGEKGKESGRRKQSKNEFRALLCLSEKEEEKTEEVQGKDQTDTLSDSCQKEKPEEEKEGEQGKDQANDLSESSEKQKPEEKKTKGEQGEDRADILSDSSQSSLFTYPANNRYKNCLTSDHQCEDTALNKCNLVEEVVSNYKDKNGHEGPMLQEESSESLFSLSIDSRKQSSAHEIGDKEVSSPFKPCDRVMNNKKATDRNKYVDSVLNPIENLSQWKAVRAKPTSSLKNQEKENVRNLEEFTMAFAGKENLPWENEFIIPFSEEPTLKQSKRISIRPKDDDIAVDTSLSSWLIESEGTPIKENSPCSSIGNSSSKGTKSPKGLEDRPILGALTLEELKLMSRHSSPGRSTSFSPDETPIIGTVGSYWRHTGQAADADSGSSCEGKSSESTVCRKGKMNSHSRHFEIRLEKAMNSVAAEF